MEVAGLRSEQRKAKVNQTTNSLTRRQVGGFSWTGSILQYGLERERRVRRHSGHCCGRNNRWYHRGDGYAHVGDAVG